MTKQKLKLDLAPKPKAKLPRAKYIGAVATVTAVTEPACEATRPKQGKKNSPVVAPSTTSVRKTDERLKRRLLRSGGPKTAEGKARSSLNSFKHGAYAKRLPEGDGYYDLQNAAKLELQPRGFIETACVGVVSHEVYRRGLLEDIEVQRIRASDYKRIDPSELARRIGFPFGPQYHHILVEPKNTFEILNDFRRDWIELASPPASGAVGELETKEDGLVVRAYKNGCELLKTPQCNPYLHEEFIEKIGRVMDSARRGKNYLGRRIADRGREIMLVNYWLIVHRTELSMCIHEMRNDLKVTVLTDVNLSRAKKHVNSNLSSALNQLAAVRDIKYIEAERIHNPKSKKR